MRTWNSPTCRCAVLSCGAPGHRSCLLGRPHPEPALTRVRLQTIPQRLMEGAAPVWRFWAFCLWAEESRFPDANRFLDSQSGRGTLTSEKLPDEDNDDEKHDD